MKLRVPNLTEGYRQVLSDIEKIMEKDMTRKEIEEMFNAYGDITNSDEAAAILTLAEVLKVKEKHPDAKEGQTGEGSEVKS